MQAMNTSAVETQACCMSDRAVGVAVLCDPLVRESGDDSAFGYIYFVAQHGDGRSYICDVPIVEFHRYDAVKAKVGCPLWAYQEVGDTLLCHPSVNDQGHGWHNSTGAGIGMASHA